jgi:hypothetical protein
MNHYLVTLIQGATRTVRKVIASNSMQATLIGIRMMPDTHQPVSIFCKPIERTGA